MSTERGDAGAPAAINEKAVVDFLQERPDFFERHAKLLAEMVVPHPTEGRVMSLVERQVSVLKEQKDALESKLKQLAQAAKTNEHLLLRLQHLFAELMDCDGVDQAYRILESSLRGDFHADEVGILLIRHEGGLHSLERMPVVDGGDARLKAFEVVLGDREPICGYLTSEQSELLFGEAAGEIASGAVIPLAINHREPCLGLVALGSVDPKRFHQDLGTFFLQHLGVLVACAIKRLRSS